MTIKMIIRVYPTTWYSVPIILSSISDTKWQQATKNINNQKTRINRLCNHTDSYPGKHTSAITSSAMVDNQLWMDLISN